ncbi:MAG: helix-turn-helix domain-containing protein, partial [Gammaproteobacteria bacterium]|nr:helix-turn-helix domain-containing protein [Gammaproteobacteria bacterium]
STRFKQRGFSDTDLNLSMSRHEIGSFLGLAVETVSRLFTRFQDEGLLRVERKHVEILNPAGLQAIIHQDGQTNLNRRRFS